MSKDYYKILDVKKNATQEEIKSKYRAKAKEYHPDINKAPDAASKFREIGEAYEVLGNQEKRAEYDRYGSTSGGPNSGFHYSSSSYSSSDFGDFSDIFSNFFSDFGSSKSSGSKRHKTSNEHLRGSDLRYDLSITLEEAFNGKTKTIKYKTAIICNHCKGTGSSKDTKQPEAVCTGCRGNGKVRMQQGLFIIEQTCSICRGSGKVIKDPCNYCSGEGRIQKEKTTSITIPRGIKDGERVKIPHEGEAGVRNNDAGDLYIFVSIKKHNLYKRDGDDIYCEVPIKMTTAVLGGIIEIVDIGSTGGENNFIKLTVPSGTQNGTKLRLREKGMPIINSNKYGDLIVVIRVEIPVNLTDTQKDLLKKFDQDCGKHSNPDCDGFFQKMKNFMTWGQSN